MADASSPPDLLAPNATPLMRALSSADGVTLAVPTEFLRDLNDPATCPAQMLPYLAHRRAVRVWDPAWPVETMRAVVAAAYTVKARGGTLGALEDAVDALGIGLQVREWFNYGGLPYRFRLALRLPTGAGWDGRLQSQIYRTARTAKNARSRLETLEVGVSGAESPVYLAAVVNLRVHVKPRP